MLIVINFSFITVVVALKQKQKTKKSKIQKSSLFTHPFDDDDDPVIIPTKNFSPTPLLFSLTYDMIIEKQLFSFSLKNEEIDLFSNKSCFCWKFLLIFFVVVEGGRGYVWRNLFDSFVWILIRIRHHNWLIYSFLFAFLLNFYFFELT